MSRQGVGRRPESVHCVAEVTLVPVPRVLELSGVNILMAIQASFVRTSIMCVFARRDVALRAFDGGMLPEQWVGALLVHGNGEQRRLKHILVMTARAVLSAELALMRIGRMAVGALQVGNRLFEISSSLMAIEAGCFYMRSMQRESCSIMIEVGRRLQLFPAEGGMATLTGSREGASMRIFVAIRANVKRDVLVLNKWLTIFGSGRVALFARNIGMQASQLIARLGVIKTRSRLPGFDRVAAGAIGPELTPVLVCMTGSAGRGDAQIGVVQVLHLDARTIGLQNPLRVMAALAGESCMLASQRVASLPMIELASRRLPFDDVEIFAVMLGVAARAVLPAIRVLHHPCVKAAAGLNPLPDLSVATEASQARRSSSESVTRGALGRPGEI